MRYPVYPPGPKDFFPGMSLIAMKLDMLGFLERLVCDYGDIVHFKLGPRSIVLVNHPDRIRDILVTDHRYFTKGQALEISKPLLGNGLLTSEGEYHRKQRSLVQPAFHRNRIDAYAELMTYYALRLQSTWKEGIILNMEQEMVRLTMAIVGKTLFGSEVESEAYEFSQALSKAIRILQWRMLPFADRLEHYALPAVWLFRRVRRRLDATIYRIITEHRATGMDRGDLLSALLLAQDSSMTDTQIRDEVMTMFLAGHETTATVLTWTWYLLSQHPEIEAKLHAEIDEVLSGRPPTLEDVPRLVYTWMVLKESARLYPPAWAIGRRVQQDYPIDKYVIPAGAGVMLCQYLVHRDPRYYPDPLRFAPDRWVPEDGETRPKFAYFPFGGGPRVCIGETFAWMEAILALATLARHWKLRLVPGHPVKLQPLVTLRPKYGLKMTAHHR
jgi:cytochrome P450